MANQSKLKAWVRYDGTGRVISGGPIFQVNKPKVGNWKQIDANLCCNGNPSSTTTTTTAGGGGGTPTAFIKFYWFNATDACNTTAQGSLLFYSASTVYQPGIAIFTDAALTIPVTQGFVLGGGGPFAMDRYIVGAGGVLSLFTCTTTSTTTSAPVLSFIGRGGNSGDAACLGNTQTFYTTGPLVGGNYPQNGNVIYFDQALTQLVTYPYVSVPGVGQLFDCTNGVLSNMASC
jgi:hypothetical protein